jgi:hypothetical protein
MTSQLALLLLPMLFAITVLFIWVFYRIIEELRGIRVRLTEVSSAIVSIRDRLPEPPKSTAAY